MLNVDIMIANTNSGTVAKRIERMVWCAFDRGHQPAYATPVEALV